MPATTHDDDIEATLDSPISVNGVSHGGTGSDMSATGPGFAYQSALGAAFTAVALPAAGFTGTLAEAVAAATAQTYGGTVLLSSGVTYTVTDNLTVPADVTIVALPGSRIEISSTKTLTFTGGLSAGRHELFAGSGSVAFTIGCLVEAVYPEWFGSSGANFATAIAASTAGRLPLKLAHRSYAIPTTGLVLTDFATIIADLSVAELPASIAEENTGAELVHTGASGTWAVTVGKNAGSGTDYVNNAHIRNVRIRCTVIGANGLRWWYAHQSSFSGAVRGATAGSSSKGISYEACVEVQCEGYVSGFTYGVSSSRASTTARFSGVSHYNTHAFHVDSTVGTETWLYLNKATGENNTNAIITETPNFPNVEGSQVWLENNSGHIVNIQSGSGMVTLNSGQMSVPSGANAFALAAGARLSLHQVKCALNTPTTSPTISSIGAGAIMTIAQSRFIGAGTLVLIGTTYPGSTATWKKVRVTDMSVQALRFTQATLAGTQAFTGMNTTGNGGTTWKMSGAGDILGVVFTYTSTLTAGTFGYRITKNGTPITGFTEAGLTAVPHSADAEHWQFPFADGDALAVELETSGFTTSGATLVCDLLIARGEDNRY